jgi:hypothetical protein
MLKILMSSFTWAAEIKIVSSIDLEELPERVNMD